MDRADRPARCPRCGANLSADAPEGLCPACMLAAASEPLSHVSGEEPTILQPAGASGARRPGLTPGQRFGPYRIERLLGRGGMGDVYEAEQLEQGRRVALKVLSRRLADPQDRARFLREGQLAASISHPHCVYIFGSEEIDGTPVIAMELLPGGTLKDRVVRDGPLPPAQAVDAILQVIAGLDAAQAAGILHRDIKPSNCFVDSAGLVKVGDFGLSISTLARDVSPITIAGTFQGTPQFAAPEQLRGEPLDLRADVYAVGATLYYLLTGRPPFDERDLLTLVARIASEPPSSPRSIVHVVPRGLSAVVLRCLAKDRAQRPPAYAPLDDELRPFGSAAPTPATLGVRFLAGIVDSVVKGLPFLPMAMSLATTAPGGARYLWLGLLGTGSSIAYFGISEGCWGASIGKWVCGLRVTGPDGQRPGLPRALMRALIFEFPALTLALPSLLLGTNYMRLMAGHPAMAWVESMPFYILLGVLFSTARRRNGFAGLHELASRTRVVQRMTRDDQRDAIDAPVERTAAAERSQDRYGPFEVVGALGATDAGELLLGFDPSLRRAVWIHVLPPGTPALAPIAREASRAGRLHWLSGRRTAGEAWDAYEALDGAPFVEMLGRPQPWRRVRYWLLDLTREIDAALRDGPLPALALDRVWISRDGRAKLLDFRAPGARPTAQPEPAATFAAAQVFLSAFARSALDGAAGVEDAAAGWCGPLPLSATTLLATLSAHAFASPQDLIARAASLTSRTDRVEGWRRAMHIALCAAPPLVITLTVVLLTPFMLRRMYTPDMSALSTSLAELSAIPANASGEAGQKRQALEVYIAGRFGPLLADAQTSPSPMVAAILNTHRAQTDRIRAAHPHVSPADTAKAAADLGPWLTRIEQPPDTAFEAPTALLMEALNFFLMALFGVASAVIFKGGWLLHAFGIAVVTRRGEEASRWRTLFRGLVAWSPALAFFFAALQAPLLSSDLASTIREFPLSLGLALTTGAVFAVGAMFAVLHPERGWQDRVAGTYLVPR